MGPGEMGSCLANTTTSTHSSIPCQHQPSTDIWGEPMEPHLGATANARMGQICCLPWLRLAWILGGKCRRQIVVTCCGVPGNSGRNPPLFPLGRGSWSLTCSRHCWLWAQEPPATKTPSPSLTHSPMHAWKESSPGHKHGETEA